MFAVPLVERDLRGALARLGKKRLVLAVHDASFPSEDHENVGRGSPYDRGARRFLEEVRALGFDAIQLGPQGQTTLDNPSPYDGTAFSRSWLSIGLLPLVEEGLLPKETLERIVAERPREQVYRYAYRAKRAALEQISAGSFASELAEYRALHRSWLEPDAIYDALEAEQSGRHFRDWPAALQRFDAMPEHEAAIERWALWQLIAERQHRELRAHCRTLGLSLFGDLQVGLSPRDVWRWRALFLPDLSMGAPPSRTNPAGQAWGYPVLDPDQYASGGLAFLIARLERMKSAYDGIRIDHPHGIVCPWVYRHDVVQGARLFCSPDRPELARYAIPLLEQIDLSAAPWDDRRVRSLSAADVDRYALLFDAVVARAGLLICEVLSTQPYPLGEVLSRHGLGRFRVTQKANLDDPDDVYRSENAKPPDWIMVGTHDTPSIWRLARDWQSSGEAKRQSDYLARRLLPRAEPAAIERFATELAGDARRLVHAKFADAFASDAENVMIFFADLYGLEERYNRPGIVDDENWMLRVGGDREPALDLGNVLNLALRAKSDNA